MKKTALSVVNLRQVLLSGLVTHVRRSEHTSMTFHYSPLQTRTLDVSHFRLRRNMSIIETAILLGSHLVGATFQVVRDKVLLAHCRDEYGGVREQCVHLFQWSPGRLGQERPEEDGVGKVANLVVLRSGYLYRGRKAYDEDNVPVETDRVDCDGCDLTWFYIRQY